MPEYVTQPEFKTAQDKIDARFDKVEAKLKAVLVQNGQTHERLDAILEYLPGLTPLAPRVTQLEEATAEHEVAIKLNRYHLNELRHDFENHQH